MYVDNGQAAYWEAQLRTWGPRVIVAIAILVLTWLIARAVKAAISRGVNRSPALQRHQAGSDKSVGDQLGNVAYLLIWLTGIVIAATQLNLGQAFAPVATLTNELFSFLPRLIGAGLIFFVGLIVARIVRTLVETALGAANVDGLLARAGIGSTQGTTRVDPASVPPGAAPGATRNTLAKAAGIVVFALIIIPVAIAALNVLNIPAITVPATNMLNQVLAGIPRVVAAALWLAIAYAIGMFVKQLIESVLPAAGFDRTVAQAGITPPGTSASRVVGNIVLTAILLFASIEAARQLGGAQIAGFLAEITALGGRVIFGTAIILAGIFLARILSGLASSSSGSDWAATLVRWAIYALFIAIGLRFMGLANEIVILAFGLILGSAAVAAALAFGLGGREPARELLTRYVNNPGAIPSPPPAPKRLGQQVGEQAARVDQGGPAAPYPGTGGPTR